jgi:hypothetical protein
VQYQTAYNEFDPQSEYRRLVEVKLNALGVDPVGLAQAAAANDASASGSQK